MENTKSIEPPKPFAKYTQVVEGLKSIDGLDTAIMYTKFYYEHDQSIEENIKRITDFIERDH